MESEKCIEKHNMQKKDAENSQANNIILHTRRTIFYIFPSLQVNNYEFIIT
jgi:hypothetical protein